MTTVDTASIERCSWAEGDPLMRAYHDSEWGVPQLDARMLWEMLMLESFQAGLSWITILRKRDAFRAAFAGFDPVKVAAFGSHDAERLMADPGIVRAKAKIDATIQGAQIFCDMQARGEDFAGRIQEELRAAGFDAKAAAVPANLEDVFVEATGDEAKAVAAA